MCLCVFCIPLLFDLCIMFSLLQFKDNLPIISIYLFIYGSPTLRSTHTHTQISFRSAVEMSLVWFLWPLPISHGVLFRIALCCSPSPPLHIPTSVYRVLFIQEICALFSSICAMFLLFSLSDSRSSSG